MRRAARVWTLGVALGATTASAQGPEAPVPDVPSGPATVEGRVVHAESGTPLAGVDVVLYALTRSGVPGVRRTRSGEAGAFSFPGVSNDPDTAYLIGARYRDVPFPGERISFEPDQSRATLEIRVSEPSADASKVEVLESVLRLDPLGAQLAVREIHRVLQPGPKTAYVPEGSRRPERAGFRSELPDRAVRFEMPFGVVPEGVTRDGQALAFYGPFYPGEHEIRFAYELEPQAEGGFTLRKRFPSGARRAVVQVPEDALAPSGPDLGPATRLELDGRRYREYEIKGSVPPGRSVTLRVAAAPQATDLGLRRRIETRVFLELDDAALTAREEHRFAVEGSQALVAPAGEPVLSLPLPVEADEIRFSPNARDLGLSQEVDGQAALLGPIPPGETTLEVLYRIRARDGSVQLERSFGERLPLLTVYIADTGLVAESKRLHRRRPVRTPERTYLHLEAFELEPGEPVRLRLTPLPARSSLPRAARIGLVALVAAGLIWVLTAPLGTSRRQAERTAPPRTSRLREEREAVYEAIRDLEHDREMGKLTEEDYALLHRELRNRAVELLRLERAGGSARDDAPEPAPGRRCPRCRTEPRPDDRFCAQCGTPLAHDAEQARREARA